MHETSLFGESFRLTLAGWIRVISDGVCDDGEVRSKDVALEMMDGMTRSAAPAVFW
jgi:hypothetical protein